MQERLEKIKSVLLSVMPDVYHYTADQKKEHYIVWAEDSGGSVHAVDDRVVDQAIVGTVDYYTKTEFDKNIDLIAAAMIDAKISFRLNSVQYEDETGYIHYEWLFEV